MPRKARRERVEQGLYRAGKTYIACATASGQRRPRWKTLGEVGLMEARRRRDEWRVEVRSGRAPREGVDQKMTFAAIAADWLRRQEQLRDVGELAPRTYDAYESSMRLHLVPFFGSRRVRSIGADDLMDWHADQRISGAAAWSIKGRWTALRLILAWAARRGVIAQNPAELLERRERPTAGAPRPRFITDDEIKDLLRAARPARAKSNPRSSPRPPRTRLLIAVCLFGGLRISEALGLVWSDVDFEAGRIRVREQLGRDGKRVKIKTPAARRDVILMPSLATMLKLAKMAAPFSGRRDPVFATSNRTALSTRNATRSFEKAVERAGLEGVTNHTLRHTFASMLIAQGRDPVFVADQLGHTDPSVTLRTYAHLFRAAKQAREAQDALEGEYGHLLRGEA